MFPWTASHHGKKRWRARAKMMDASLMVEEVVEEHMGESLRIPAWDKLWEERSCSVSTRKRALFIPSCLPVCFESRKTYWKLLWEESVLKKEKEILLREGIQTRRVIETCVFVVCVTPAENMESWEGRKLRSDWNLWVLMGKCWPSTNMGRQLML